MNKSEHPGGLILALNRALLGEVSSNMRAALISLDGSELFVRFVFFHSPSEDEIESMGFITTEVVASFGESFTIRERYDVDDVGRVTPAESELLVYRRKD